MIPNRDKHAQPCLFVALKADAELELVVATKPCHGFVRLEVVLARVQYGEHRLVLLARPGIHGCGLPAWVRADGGQRFPIASRWNPGQRSGIVES